MAKQQFDVNMRFTADITKAKQSMTELQKTLQQIMNNPMRMNDKDIMASAEAAKQLTYHLNKAFDVSTGKLDLKAFNSSLKSSNTNVTALSNNLLKSGELGQQAFMKMAQAISKAEFPVLRVNSHLAELWKTMKNTARWQLSSSMLHGFMGAIQTAHGYAQDLNDSLNNIRIVTGQNINQMTKFAEEANKAAKALSTTTTDYTNASLIFYQQGLSEKEVKERTDITIKMANAANVDAQKVSDQLTAVWNNFYDGSKSLEYYADVMTALGAATASSTDEISEGLNKFAAVADSVGLSYEYATAALATITSNTRESADVVGNSLKTLFARIQGLQLGDTMEDGTTLNKYSEALSKIGISIYDTTGGLKDMDNILDEMAQKWETLTDVQQVALAQTVAGVRQYNQLIALMENWNSGDADSMTANLKTANESSGVLQEQADIYAESWKAASKEVKASLEGIYQSLLDDKFFISFNKSLSEVFSGIESFIDSIGGIKSIFLSIGSVILGLVANNIEPALKNIAHNITVTFTGAKSQIQKFVKEANEVTEQQIISGNYNIAQEQELRNTNQLMIARQQLSISSKEMSEQEYQMAEYTLQGLTIQQQQAQEIANTVVELEKQKQSLLDTAAAVNLNTDAQRTYATMLRILNTEQAAKRQDYMMEEDSSKIDEKIKAYHQAREATEFYETTQIHLVSSLEKSTDAILNNYNAISQQKGILSGVSQKIMAPFIEQISALGKGLQKSSSVFGSETDTLMIYADALNLIQKGMPPILLKNKEVKNAFDKAFDTRSPQEFIKVINSMLIPALKGVGLNASQIKETLKSMDGKKFLELESNAKALSKKETELLNIQKQLNAAFESFNPGHMVTGIERIASGAAMLGQVSMTVTSLKSAFDALFSNDTDLSPMERFTSILMSISMFVPGVIGSFRSLSKAIQGTTLETWLYAKAMKNEKFTHEEIIAMMTVKKALQKGEVEQQTALAAVKTLVIAALKKEGIALNKNAEAQFDNVVKTEMAQGADLKTAITKALVTLKTNTNRQAVTKETAAKVANKVATDALNVSLKSLLGVFGVIIAVIGVAIAGFSAWSESQKKMAEQRAEDAASAREQVNSLKEETKQVKELYDAYLTAKGVLDKSQSSKDSLRSATEELCKALGVEWDALDKLQGKYEDVNEEILKAQLLSLEDAAKKAQESKNRNEALYVDNAKADKPGAFGAGIGVSENGNFQVSFGWDYNDEKDVIEAYKAWRDKNGLNEKFTENIVAPGFFQNGYFGINTEGITSTEMAELMYSFYDYLYNGSSGLERSQLENSEIAQYFKSIGEKMKEPMEGAQEADSYMNELIPQIAEKRAQLSLPGVLEDIKNEEDYEKYRTQYIQTLEATYKQFGEEVPTNLETIADNYFSQYDFLKPVVETSQYLEGIKEKLKANGETDTAIEEFVTHLKENNLVEVVASVITDNSTIDSLNFVMDSLQEYADSEQIIVRWKLLPTAQSELTKNMSPEKYQAWLDKYAKDLFGESGMLGGMSQDFFNSLSFDQKQAVLENAYSYTNMNQVYENRIQSEKNLLKQHQENRSSLKMPSINQAAAGAGIYDIDSNTLGHIRDIGILENEKNLFNSQSIIDQQNKIQQDMITQLMEIYSITEAEARDKLQGWIKQYGSLADMGQKIVEEYDNQVDKYLQDESAYNREAERLENSIAALEAEQKVVSSGQLSNKFSEANNLEGLYNAKDFGIENKIDLNYDIYAEALMRIATSYDSCTTEIEHYKKALEDGEYDQIKATQNTLEASVLAAELAKSYNLDAKAIERYADSLEASGNYQTANIKSLTQMSKDQLRFDRAVNTASENMEDWIKDLKVASKTGYLVSETAEEMASAYGDLLDIDGSELSSSFLMDTDNFENLKKALKGDEEAYKALQEAVKNDIEIRLNLDSNEEFQTALADLEAKYLNSPLWNDIEVGATINDTNFIAGLENMINAANMTAQQATDYLSSMGIDAEVITQPKAIEEVQGYNLVAHPDTASISYNPGAEAGGEALATYPTVTYDPQPVITSRAVTALKVTSASKSSGGAIKRAGSTTANSGSNAKKNKGGSKKKPAEKVKKTDIVERYKEVNDLLDDVADAMEDASKAADRLYGKGRLDLMKKNNDLLKQEIELTKQKKEEALKYLDEDLDAMFKAASKAGVILTTDENGLITNYTEAMTKLYEELDAEITKVNKDGNADENEQERIDKIQKRIKTLQDAIKQYDDTRELIEDLDNDLDEKFYEWQDNNYEMLTYELEIKLELNEDDLKIIDYYLNKISDDFYKMAEAAALMVGNDGVNQLEAYTSNLSSYEDHVNSLKEAYANGEISQTAYVDGLREAQDGMLSNLESLNQLDKTMMHYYGDTLNMAMDEISKYIDHMDHLTEVLDHYQSLMEVLGKETDYETMGIILEGKAKTLEDQAKVAKATMEMYKGEAEDRYQAYQQALLDGDQAAAELYLQQYEDALAAADEAEEDYLSRAEEWADALKAVLENKLSGFSQTLENALTGGTSFDQMTSAMERAASLQEEYLTTTNKIYETNKLMRQAQQEIDKTSNSVAKQRLKNFIEETNELQDQTKLSNYELEIQKAKYDLLLAEIALEEAQNAKSIVRLQRDNEGNFGYVYTADSDAINNAEQEMLDKQNDLYNIALEGANDYNEKYQQTLNEMYDTLTDLQEQYLEGAFESEEEYHAAMEAAKEYYYEKLKQYSELHAIALVTDSRVINDAWSSDFNDMIQNTETWKDKVNEYVGNVTVAFDEWKNGIDSIIQDTGLDEIADKVGNIVSESEQLKETLIGEDGDGGIVGAINLEIEAVKDVTEQYATLRGQLEEVRTAYEDIATAIGEVIKAQSEAANSKTPTVTPYDPQQGGSQTPKDTDTSGDKKGNLGGRSICPKCGKEKSKCTCDSEPKSVTVTLYSTNHTKAKMGTFTVDSEEDFTIGAETNAEHGGFKMYPVDGKGVHGYIDKADRNKIREILGFATGGYTGNWSGPYGKLAFLHQKELVLNKNDTENFLASMEILERILQVIDLQSASSQIGGLLSAPGFSGNNSTLEQNVHIDAAFPNVTNSEEIEEAFNNLINLASQYAYRS